MISNAGSEWVSECVGFNVPLDTFIRGRLLQARWPNQQCQSTEGNQLIAERLESHQNHSTVLQYNTLGNRLYTQRKGLNVTNPICLTCKNCSHKCAADCEHPLNTRCHFSHLPICNKIKLNKTVVKNCAKFCHFGPTPPPKNEIKQQDAVQDLNDSCSLISIMLHMSTIIHEANLL